MNLEEAKKLFEENHPEETKLIKGNVVGNQFKIHAECVWHGFKSALKLTGQLSE